MKERSKKEIQQRAMVDDFISLPYKGSPSGNGDYAEGGSPKVDEETKLFYTMIFGTDYDEDVAKG